MKKKYVQMADTSQKNKSFREAIASGKIFLKKETIIDIKNLSVPKGDVLTCAKIAAINGCKKTAELLPLCHSITIDYIDIDFDIKDNFIEIKSFVKSYEKTGVEMEALMAVSICALTIYDMCKPIDKDIVISDIKLLKKTGGKSGIYVRKN